MLRVTKTIGDIQLTYESNGEDLKEEILKISWLTNAPKECGICSSQDIILQARKTKDSKGKDFIYAEFKCLQCWASATLGEFLAPKGALFVKKWVARERIEQKDEAEK